MPEIGHNSSSRERKDGVVMLKEKWWKRLVVSMIFLMLFLVGTGIYCLIMVVLDIPKVPSAHGIVLLCGAVVVFSAHMFCVFRYEKYNREDKNHEREETLRHAQAMLISMRKAGGQSLTQALDTLKSSGIYFDECEKSIVVPEYFSSVTDNRDIPLLAGAIITLCKGVLQKYDVPATGRICADAVQKLLYGHMDPMIFVRVVRDLGSSLRWPEGHPLA